ncbi:MAG: DUF1194 domain-containing protein [Rhizobiaceae bacterium]|nr:DUF1194 domain-containing protein [Rhizobiaceae bacterium]MCV0408436.1 DUF1194 domain-containing protein [Rhizobiaceae bacterium]
MDRARRLTRWLFSAAAAAATALAPAVAQDSRDAQAQRVDVELVLAVDVSLSMSPQELAIQRDGYAAAITDEDVLGAILDGAHGRIAVTYFEWAGDFVHNVVVPWMAIGSRADAQAFAEALTANPPGSARRTSISGALDFASGQFDDNGFEGFKRIVDISGDGPNNQGRPVLEARADILAKGIIVNGLPLMTTGGYSSVFDVKDLDLYYENCVIGGPGAFLVPVNDWSQFPEAVRRKLVLELASAPRGRYMAAAVVPAQAEPDADYDCLIGEKRWMNRSWMWDEP